MENDVELLCSTQFPHNIPHIFEAVDISIILRQCNKKLSDSGALGIEYLVGKNYCHHMIIFQKIQISNSLTTM
jgi:hypothetical protein